MKKVTILCVGKIKEKYLLDGIAEYAKRLSRFCAFEIVEIPDEKGGGEVKKESDTLLTKMKGYCILLDLKGKQVTSPQLSAIMEKAYLTSPEITFIIGGSYGIDESVKKLANLKLSISDMTFPHTLARVMLVEQLYRAFTISVDGKYHK